MDFEQLLTLATDNLSDYFSVLFYSLREPSKILQILADSKGDKSSNATKLSPKLFVFLLISVFVGRTAIAAVEGKTLEEGMVSSLIIVLSLWFVYSSLLHLFCRLLRGKGRYLDTLSVGLQVLASIYVLCSVATLLLSVVVGTSSSGLSLYFGIQLVLMSIYLPLSIGSVHRFKVWRQLILIAPTFLFVVYNYFFYATTGQIGDPAP